MSNDELDENIKEVEALNTQIADIEAREKEINKDIETREQNLKALQESAKKRRKERG